MTLVHVLSFLLLGQPLPADPRPAGASTVEIPLRVEFEAPPGCSSPDAFYGGVRTRTSRVRPAIQGERARDFRVRLTRSKAGVHGELSSANERGRATRVVDGVSCEEVVDALALTAALALDPNALFTPVAPEPRGERAQSTPNAASPSPSQPSTANPKALPTPRPSAPNGPPRQSSSDNPPGVPGNEPQTGPGEAGARALRWAVGLEVLTTRVATSGTSFGASLFARLAYPLNGILTPSLELSLLHVRDDLFQSAERVSTHLSGVALSACPVLVRLTTELAVTPCALAVGGWLDAHAGEDLRDPRSVARSWWSLGALLRGSVAFAPDLALELEAGLSFPLVERRFVAEQPDSSQATLSRTPTLAPLAGLGLSWTP